MESALLLGQKAEAEVVQLASDTSAFHTETTLFLVTLLCLTIGFVLSYLSNHSPFSIEEILVGVLILVAFILLVIVGILGVYIACVQYPFEALLTFSGIVGIVIGYKLGG